MVGGSYLIEKKENGEDENKVLGILQNFPILLDEMPKLSMVLYLCQILCVHISFMLLIWVTH